MSAARPQLPDDVFFPVVPMLDMSFQLLAFFILTFQAPTRETRIDLDLPASPVVAAPSNRPRSDAADLIGAPTELIVRARAGASGELASLRLQQAILSGPDDLATRLRKLVALAGVKPVEVSIVADANLNFEATAKLVGACSLAGVGSIRLPPPPPAPETIETGPSP
jgi:biopolymer transport protein ExbD